MNERIEELFGQALDEVVSETWSKLTPGQVTRLAEKLTELVVRECAELANEETSLPYNSYSEKIKKHFGIEE